MIPRNQVTNELWTLEEKSQKCNVPENSKTRSPANLPRLPSRLATRTKRRKSLVDLAFFVCAFSQPVMVAGSTP
jgi:hypothetical protein